ncbi:MAG: GTPase Era [Gemmatimonadetes bacterium]|nr:GTPase Era [Gemmatimonadota bacterium]NNL30260.1 GTPase Era [Gemmatimonadota bacterium]
MSQDQPINPPEDGEHPTRAGYVALVGRPNAGKSTLLNQMVGEHLSIVTPKAQTTWKRVTGLLTVGPDQLIFLDTPGLLEARDLLQKSMLGAALEALQEADVVLVVVDTTRPPSDDDRERILGALEGVSVPVHVALNKIDEARGDEVDAWASWIEGELDAEVHRISALDGQGVAILVEALREALPEGPFLYPDDEIATEPVRFFVAELVRETIFEQFRQEIPYSVFCQVEAFRESQDPVYIQVVVYVERKSQKGMVIGKGGAAIRELGRASRAKIEHFLGRAVYLDLWVKPLRAWRKNRAHLGRLGFRVPPEDDSENR